MCPAAAYQSGQQVLQGRLFNGEIRRLTVGTMPYRHPRDRAQPTGVSQAAAVPCVTWSTLPKLLNTPNSSSVTCRQVKKKKKKKYAEHWYQRLLICQRLNFPNWVPTTTGHSYQSESQPFTLPAARHRHPAQWCWRSLLPALTTTMHSL